MNNLVNIIVMYTIRTPNEKLRGEFNKRLMETFNLTQDEELNESAYRIDGHDIPEVEKQLKDIIEKLQQEGYSLGQDDFIDIYYAANKKSETYKDQQDREKIIRHPIFPTKRE